MSNCCSTSGCEVEPDRARKPLCPECGRKGARVETQTLQHLLRDPLAAEIGEKPYYFCRTPDCETVYFSTSAAPVFHKPDLKVRVGLKETEDPIPVCYCFGHTRASIWEEIERTGKSTVIDSVKWEVEQGHCRCEVTNPSGNCCLGDVTGVVREGLRNRTPVL